MTASGDPGDFDALFRRAVEAHDGGDLERANAIAARLARDYGERPGVLWLAARTALARGEAARARAIVERLLVLPAPNPLARAEALLLHGQVLDRLGLAAPAFRAAAEGKAIQRQVFAERAAGREGQIEKLERLAAWFAAADGGEWTTSPEPLAVPGEAAGHVFLVGFPRSGTTLLEQALAGHRGIVTLEEAPTLADAYAEFLASAEGLERLARLTAREAHVWRARYWRVVGGHGASPRGRVFVDKAPAETLSLPIIARLFPRARVLFAVRDPRDVVLSCFLNNFQMNALTFAFTDLADTARCYGACMALAEIYRGLLPLPVRDVRYDALVGDFAGELAAVAAFIGVAFEAAMTDVATTAGGRVVRTPSGPQIRAGLNRGGLERWRSYAAELAPTATVLAPWIARFGYEP